MSSINIKRVSNFSIDKYLEESNIMLPAEDLKKSDLLLLPYNLGEMDRKPAFMMGTYDLIKKFKEEYSEYNVQPIYSTFQPQAVVFNDISVYFGSFFLTSILAPLFVNWIIHQWKNKKDEDVNINITINILDKSDEYYTAFSYHGDINCLKKEFLPRIEDYSSLKGVGKLNQFDEKFIGKSIDFKA